MEIIRVNNLKYYGEYKVYSKEDFPSHLQYRLDYENAIPGDWILSDDGVVARVLDIPKAKGRCIVTAFGIDRVQSASGRRIPLHLKRKRIHFSMIGLRYRVDEDGNKILSTRDKSILMYLVLTGDEYTAYERATDRKITTLQQKYVATHTVRKLFNNPLALEYVRKMLKKVMEEEGMDTRWFVKKLKEGTDNFSDPSPVQKELLFMAGKLIPEVRKDIQKALADDESSGDDSGRLPSPKEASEEAHFREICSVCGTYDGVIRSIDENGKPCETRCSRCSDKMQEVQKGNISPRV